MPSKPNHTEIMLVGDDFEFSKKFEAVLRDLGPVHLKTLPLHKGAVADSARQRPDIVFVDLSLEKMDESLETARQMAAAGETLVVCLAPPEDLEQLEPLLADSDVCCLHRPQTRAGLALAFRNALLLKENQKRLRQAEERRVEANARFHGIFQNTRDGIAVYKAVDHGDDFRIIDFNRAAEWIEQVDKSEVLGKRVTEAFPGVRDFGILEAFQRVHRTGRAEHFPLGFYKDNRLSGWRDNYIYKLPSGEVVAVYRDETENKRREQELRESEARYRGIFENAREGMFQSTPEGRFIRVNPAMARMCGYADPEEMVASVTDIANQFYNNPEDRRYYMQTMQEKGSIDQFEVQVKRRDGGIIWVSASNRTLRDDQGRPLFYEGIVEDVTERKMAELELERIFTMSLDLICIADINNLKFIKVNPAFTETLGFTEAELLGRPFTEFIYPDDVETTRHVVENFLKKGKKVIDFVNRYRCRDGSYRWLRWVSHPKVSEGRTYAVAHDITREKVAERDRERLEEQLRQAHKMEAVGTLAGGVAHDFNNLLQAIIGSTQMLLLDKAESDPDHHNLTSILKSCNRAARLVQQLLLFSRKVEADRQAVDVNREIMEIKRILERTIPKMIRVEVLPGAGLWTVMADPVQIEQILLNMGGNAADAMPEGGELVIKTENIQVDREYAARNLGVAPGKYVLLTVSDTGHGMPREVLDHIFEPFFTTKEVGRGTGLGMASVYGIVKGHGGFINCYSEPGQGTSFKIYLPALETEIDRENRQVEGKRLVGGTETILLVEDEESIRELGVSILDRFGYTVLTAPRGEEALEILEDQKTRLDLVILDLNMPGMGGQRCLREIMRRYPKTKVLIASGYSISGQARRAIEAGARGFIDKPFHLADLLGRVREVLDEDK